MRPSENELGRFRFARNFDRVSRNFEWQTIRENAILFAEIRMREREYIFVTE